MSTKALMTVEQFTQMDTADTEKFELVEGELVLLSRGTYRHNKIRDLIVSLLWSYFTAHPIGNRVAETDCQIGPETVRCPDVSIFLGNRLQTIDEESVPVPFAPDIAVEVLSPSEKAIDVRRKVLDYLRAGSQEVWLVDHANGEILVHTSGGIRVLEGHDVLESRLLPGFSVCVANLVMTSQSN